MKIFFVIALVLAAGAAQAQSSGVACKRDLLVADSSLRDAASQLGAVADGSDAEKCTAWGRHVEILKKARAVFARCATGRERDTIGELDNSVADFSRILRERCRK